MSLRGLSGLTHLEFVSADLNPTTALKVSNTFINTMYLGGYLVNRAKLRRVRLFKGSLANVDLLDLCNIFAEQFLTLQSDLFECDFHIAHPSVQLRVR